MTRAGEGVKGATNARQLSGYQPTSRAAGRQRPALAGRGAASRGGGQNFGAGQGLGPLPFSSADFFLRVGEFPNGWGLVLKGVPMRGKLMRRGATPCRPIGRINSTGLAALASMAN
jgi:hypothetical protein